MGREWLHWVGGRRRSSTGIKQHERAAGCMCAVFHLFDLHHHLPLNHHHSLSPFLHEEDTTTTTSNKGVEAPRNSLEMEEEPERRSLSIQIKTKSRTEDSPSIDSPGTKTPNLVARLMGLDLLPESNSPSFSCPNSKPPSKLSHSHQPTFSDDDIAVGACSLPATPRASSARKSDVELHHRLSLQLNKENSPRFRRQQQSLLQDENRSPGHYAKQILKQVKESVSRRVGLDITNTTRDRDEIRRDQTLLLKLSKKNSTAAAANANPTNKLRILDTNKSPRNSASSDSNPTKPKNQPAAAAVSQPQKESNKSERKLSPKCSDRGASRNRREDAFVRSPAAKKVNDKKPKKANEALLHSSGPTLLPVKKDPSPPATKLPQKQAQVSDALSSKRNTQLSSNSSRSYKQLPLDKIFAAAVPDTATATASASASASASAEHRCYVQKILKRAGIIDKLTPLTLGKWHTPSHPLDPSIFYYLELFHPAAAASSAAALSRRCNRKLIFQLVDEILAGVLRPHLDFKPFVSPAAGKAEPLALIDDLCEKIESFPAADCRVLEDIDSLIEKDLSKAAVNGYFEDEGERLVREIEGEIVERLVSETVAVVVADGVRTERQRRWMSRGEVSRDVMP